MQKFVSVGDSVKLFIGIPRLNQNKLLTVNDERITKYSLIGPSELGPLSRFLRLSDITSKVPAEVGFFADFSYQQSCDIFYLWSDKPM